MSARLEDAIRQARHASRDVAWDDARASRVLGCVTRTHRTHRALRRGALVAGGAGILVIALLRLAPAATSSEVASTPAVSEPAPEAVASIASGDAGYSRD